MVHRFGILHCDLLQTLDLVGLQRIPQTLADALVFIRLVISRSTIKLGITDSRPVPLLPNAARSCFLAAKREVTKIGVAGDGDGGRVCAGVFVALVPGNAGAFCGGTCTTNYVGMAGRLCQHVCAGSRVHDLGDAVRVQGNDLRCPHDLAIQDGWLTSSWCRADLAQDKSGMAVDLGHRGYNEELVGVCKVHRDNVPAGHGLS